MLPFSSEQRGMLVATIEGRKEQMRNFPNPPTDESLETLVERMNAHRQEYEYVSRIGMEVDGLYHRSGERHTLTPIFDPLGFAPRIGDDVECSGLGEGSQWRVVAVATGYPGRMQIQR